LTISSVTSSSAGTYYVVVTDSYGSVTSQSVTITVTSSVTAPSISTQPSSVLAPVGSSASLTVAASGSGLSYQWYRNGTPVSGATSATYSVSAVATTNIGAYDVVVTNAGGSATSNTVDLYVTTAKGVFAGYEQSGGSASYSASSYSASTANESGLWVTDSGTLALSNASIGTTGASSDTTVSAQYGLDAAVLADGGAAVSLVGGTVTSSGTGASGLFATGSGSAVNMSGGSISTTGSYAQGVGTSYSGAAGLSNGTVSTSGTYAPGAVTNAGGGTITLSGESVQTTGYHSPGLQSIGTIAATSCVISSGADNGAVVDQGGSITLTNCTLSSCTNGVLVHNTTSQAATGTVVVSDGTISPTAGDVFNVTGTTASITAKNGAGLSPGSAYVLEALSSSAVTFVADDVVLTGNLLADSTSTLNTTLKDNASLSGSVSGAGISLDGTSFWNVTANSTLTTLSDASGISGTTITNIYGNGYTVTYNASLSGNSALGGKTYSLVNGGYLVPK
jgi:hypothetical protein